MQPQDNQNSPLFALTIRQFESLMRDLMNDSVYGTSTTSSDPEKSEPEYMSMRKAALYLNISVPTLTKLSREKKIPVYRISESRVLYAKSDLDAFVRSSKEL